MTTELSLGFLDNKYNKTVALLCQTRSFEKKFLSSVAFSKVSTLKVSFTKFEINRIYRRLDEILFWIMVQRSIARREMPREVYNTPHRRLSGKAFCTVNSKETFPEKLDRDLENLLDESRSLYVRIMRLDVLLKKRILHEKS